MTFSLAWLSWLSFLSQKVDGNMIFTDYWKGFGLNFLGIGNTVFFWAKSLMERWYCTWCFWDFPDIPGLRKWLLVQ